MRIPPGRPQGEFTVPTPTEQEEGKGTPPGRPQGSPPLIRVLPRPYNDHGAARSHCRGGGGGEERWGPLWLPWGGVGPLAHTPTELLICIIGPLRLTPHDFC